MRCPLDIFIKCRVGTVYENSCTRFLDIFRRSEGHGGVVVFRGSIDPVSLGAVKRKLLTVHGKEILPEEFSQGREYVAQVADHRIVSQYGVTTLQPVQHKNRHCKQHAAAKREDKERG